MKHPRIALAALATTTLGVAALQPEEAASSARGEPVWSCQLHLHGSFSEGVGSIHSHLEEAAAVGLDAFVRDEHHGRRVERAQAARRTARAARTQVGDQPGAVGGAVAAPEFGAVGAVVGREEQHRPDCGQVPR